MLEDDLDALFAAPLSEFVAARKALAAKLKKAGLQDEAAGVNLLPKPTVSAWAVNQLYWKHRADFARLVAAGDRLRQAQILQLSGRPADVRGPLDDRRRVLSELAEAVAQLLRDQRHNPSPETLRRVMTTLEALSVYGSLPGSPHPGRLTADVDPPGFETLAQLIPTAGSSGQTKAMKVAPLETQQKRSTPKNDNVAAKAALEEAERVLSETQVKAHEALARQKEAAAHAVEAENRKREARERFEEAVAAEREAKELERSTTTDAARVAKALENAMRAVDAARQRLVKKA